MTARTMNSERERRIAMHAFILYLSDAGPRLAVRSTQLVISYRSQIKTLHILRHHLESATLSDIWLYVLAFCTMRHINKSFKLRAELSFTSE